MVKIRETQGVLRDQGEGIVALQESLLLSNSALSVPTVPFSLKICVTVAIVFSPDGENIL